jgi:hypothetical protein
VLAVLRLPIGRTVADPRAVATDIQSEKV